MDEKIDVQVKYYPVGVYVLEERGRGDHDWREVDRNSNRAAFYRNVAKRLSALSGSGELGDFFDPVHAP